jgi:hypothetical protein
MLVEQEADAKSYIMMVAMHVTYIEKLMTWKNRFKQTKITDSKYGFTN